LKILTIYFCAICSNLLFIIMTPLHLTARVYNMAFETILLNKLQIDYQHNI